MNSDKILNILIADDHHIVRQGVEFLCREIFESAQFQHASTIQQVIKTVSGQKLDFIILDVHFPDGMSINCITEILKLQPEVKIMILSSYEESTHALPFLEAGAHAYVDKMSDDFIIKSALHDVMAQGYYYSPLVKQLLELKKLHPTLSQPFSILSERELKVARLLVDGLGVLEISNMLDLKQNTVSTYKKRIFEKLKVNNLVELIEMMKFYLPK